LQEDTSTAHEADHRHEASEHFLDFFVSYTQADQKWAEWIAWQLEEAGYTTVLQAWDFPPGSNFVVAMHNAAKQTDRTIAVLSDDYVESEYGMSEWGAAYSKDAVGNNRILVPVRVKKCDPSGLLRSITWIDLVPASEAADEALAKQLLLEGVRRDRRKPEVPPDFPAAGHTPRSVLHRAPFPAAQPNFAERVNHSTDRPKQPAPSTRTRAPWPREVTLDLLIACADVDLELATELGNELSAHQRTPRVSANILPADNEYDFSRLDRAACECRAAAVLLTDTMTELLSRRPERTALAIELLEARTGKLIGLCSSATSREWAKARAFLDIVDIQPTPPRASGLAEHFADVGRSKWPLIGVPVVIVAMSTSEASELLADQDQDIAKNPPGPRPTTPPDLAMLRASLELYGLAPGAERYGSTCADWKPFRGSDQSIRELISAAIDSLNAQSGDVQGRWLKPQYYPFAPRSEESQSLLSRIHDDLAADGCVVVMDDISMFHHEIEQGYLAPLLNGPNVSLVTISPFDSAELTPSRLLESKLWRQRQFVFAFRRFERDCDPQYEFGIGDQRHLRRWFHNSLPSAIRKLRDPQPDPDQVQEFSASQDSPDGVRQLLYGQ
jgi:hypothetical protein